MANKKSKERVPKSKSSNKLLLEEVQKIRESLCDISSRKSDIKWSRRLLVGLRAKLGAVIVLIIILAIVWTYLFFTLSGDAQRDENLGSIDVPYLNVRLNCFAKTAFITEDSEIKCNVSARSNGIASFNEVRIIVHAFDGYNLTTKPLFGCEAILYNVTNSSRYAPSLCANSFREDAFKPEVTGHFKFKIYELATYSSEFPQYNMDKIFEDGRYFYNRPLTVISRNEADSNRTSNTSLVIALFSVFTVVVIEVFKFIFD